MGLKPASPDLYSHGGYAVYAHHISLRNQLCKFCARTAPLPPSWRAIFSQKLAE